MKLPAFKSVPFLGVFILGLALAIGAICSEVITSPKSLLSFSWQVNFYLWVFSLLSTGWILWLSRSSRSRLLREQRREEFCSIVKGESRVVSFVVALFNVLGHSLWVFVCAILIQASWVATMRIIAQEFLYCGNYLVAESYYKLSCTSFDRPREVTSLMALEQWKRIDDGGAISDVERKILVLKQVYGPTSAQLKHFYESLSVSYFAPQFQKGGEYPGSRESFARRGLSICLASKDDLGALNFLGLIAFDQANRGEIHKARQTIIESLRYCPDQVKYAAYQLGVSELHYAAQMVGDRSLLKTLDQRCDFTGDYNVYLRKGFSDATMLAILLALGLICSAVKMFDRLFLPSLLLRRLRNQLANSQSGDQQITLLSKLTSIYLYELKFDMAQTYSKLMLNRCEQLGKGALS